MQHTVATSHSRTPLPGQALHTHTQCRTWPPARSLAHSHSLTHSPRGGAHHRGNQNQMLIPSPAPQRGAITAHRRTARFRPQLRRRRTKPGLAARPALLSGSAPQAFPPSELPKPCEPPPGTSALASGARRSCQRATFLREAEGPSGRRSPRQRVGRDGARWAGLLCGGVSESTHPPSRRSTLDSGNRTSASTTACKKHSKKLEIS